MNFKNLNRKNSLTKQKISTDTDLKIFKGYFPLFYGKLFHIDMLNIIFSSWELVFSMMIREYKKFY